MSSKILLNKKIHDKLSQVYDKKHTEIYNEIEQNRLQQTIKELCNLKSDNEIISVLDFGAGTGNLTLKFLSLGCVVTAGDVSEKSLSVLLRKIESLYQSKINTIVLKNHKIPFPDNHFDIVATYSVLHHIPDYLFAIQEMMRVTKPKGLIYIDHESNNNRWNQNQHLKQYYEITEQTLFEHISSLIKTGELFTYDFLKTAFIKLFVNSRYEREGDIHVWKDDHIEWDKIYKLLADNKFKIIFNNDYLLYKPKGGRTLYDKYKDICNDTKYIICYKG